MKKVLIRFLLDDSDVKNLSTLSFRSGLGTDELVKIGIRGLLDQAKKIRRRPTVNAPARTRKRVKRMHRARF